jgi:hypothetical protein
MIWGTDDIHSSGKTRRLLGKVAVETVMAQVEMESSEAGLISVGCANLGMREDLDGFTPTGEIDSGEIEGL